MGEMACIAEIALAKLEMTTWPCSPWSRPIHWGDAIGDNEGMKEGTGLAVETTRLGVVEFTGECRGDERRRVWVVGIGRRVILVSGGQHVQAGCQYSPKFKMG
jgi:hypothetical protein